MFLVVEDYSKEELLNHFKDKRLLQRAVDAFNTKVPIIFYESDFERATPFLTAAQQEALMYYLMCIYDEHDQTDEEDNYCIIYYYTNGFRKGLYHAQMANIAVDCAFEKPYPFRG